MYDEDAQLKMEMTKSRGAYHPKEVSEHQE